ncbi:caffeine-induced death protein 2-domain-containing protein [Phellopilus nigrolimitatus]|nr:caffeine-induced death protein 2-domain-containing protein [Phellopilus nigrolimitatus]
MRTLSAQFTTAANFRESRRCRVSTDKLIQSMSTRQPPLGSQAVFFPSGDSKTVHVDSSTCHNLSLFKELMREYRKVDDSVTMRLNRTAAQFRDRDRHAARSTPEEEACAYFWSDLVSNWKKRTEIIEYCVNVVDTSIDGKRKAIENEDLNTEAQTRLKRASYAEEVMRNQIHNELAVEAITRQRTLDVFQTRCKFFQPPLTDAEARTWWDRASKGR